MTDRQFDAYVESLLQQLEDADEEVKKLTNGIQSSKLSRIIASLENQLKRP